MTDAMLTNVLITIVIGLIAYVSKRMIDKMDSFEKKIQEILINDMADKKDIQQLQYDIEDHEVRITKLESKHPL